MNGKNLTQEDFKNSDIFSTGSGEAGTPEGQASTLEAPEGDKKSVEAMAVEEAVKPEEDKENKENEDNQ